MSPFKFPVRTASLSFCLICSCASGKSLSAQRPEDYERLSIQAVVLVNKGKFAEAIPFYEQSLKLNPFRGNGWNSLGNARLRTGKYAEAIDAYRTALKVGGLYRFDPLLGMAKAYAKLGDKAKAMEYVNLALAAGLKDVGQLTKSGELAPLRELQAFRDVAGMGDFTKMSRVQGWRYDIQFLIRELPRRHYRLAGKLDPQIKTDLEALSGAIPNLTDNQVKAELTRIFAELGDGHSIFDPMLLMGHSEHSLPFKFMLLAGQVCVISSDEANKDLLGATVETFGQTRGEDVIKKLTQYVSTDNDIWPSYVVAGYASSLPMLNGVGLAPDGDALTMGFKMADGTTISRKIYPGSATVALSSTLKQEKPLYLQDSSKAYWYKFLPETKTVYMAYNEVRDDETPFKTFVGEMFEFIDSHDVERLVIDVRNNHGGNGDLVTPLVLGAATNKKVGKKGSLFAIIGRSTFSATSRFVGLLEQTAPVTLIGEPTGCKPNFVGEFTPFNLPYSRIMVSVSDRFHQDGGSADQRKYYSPLIYTPPTLKSIRENRDPSMEAINAYSYTPTKP